MSSKGTRMKITDQETLELLISGEAYGTLEKIRGLIMSIYHYRRYKKVDLFGLIRNADREHRELIMSIIEMISSNSDKKAFYIINVVAPLLMKHCDTAKYEE